MMSGDPRLASGSGHPIEEPGRRDAARPDIKPAGDLVRDLVHETEEVIDGLAGDRRWASTPSLARRRVVEVGGFEPPSPGDRLGLLRAQPADRSRLEAPAGGDPLGQPGCGVRGRPPDGTADVSLLTTSI